jgi:hypothetical protein
MLRRPKHSKNEVVVSKEEEEMNYGCSWDAENNVRTNFEHRSIVCLLHRLA